MDATKYDNVDWSKGDAHLAGILGVTKQAVRAARRVRGIKPMPHGGHRRGIASGIRFLKDARAESNRRASVRNESIAKAMMDAMIFKP